MLELNITIVLLTAHVGSLKTTFLYSCIIISLLIKVFYPRLWCTGIYNAIGWMCGSSTLFDIIRMVNFF